MSVFLGTRSPDQCRSHHQKMEKNYSDCHEIINHYRSGIDPQLYLAYYNYYTQNYLDKLELKELDLLQAAFWVRKSIVEQRITRNEQTLMKQEYLEAEGVAPR